MKKLSLIQVYAILSIMVALFLGGLYGYFLYSLFSIKNERLTHVEELQMSSGKEISKKENEKIREYFVFAGEEALFVSSLEKDCTDRGLVCETQSLEESLPNSDIASLQILKINLIARGDFSSIVNLLTYFEYHPYLLTLSNIKISVGEVGEGSFTISVPVVPR